MSAIAEAKGVFDPFLARYGFRLAVEHYDHESFGSAYLEYARRGLRFRLVWDGRDSFLLAQVAEVDGDAQANEWVDLEVTVNGHVSAVPEAQRPGRVEHLRQVADEYLAARRTAGHRTWSEAENESKSS